MLDAKDVMVLRQPIILSSIAKEVKNGEWWFLSDEYKSTIWNDKDDSLFVESVILGLPVGEIIAYIDNDGKTYIVDGHNRVNAVMKFMDNNFPLQHCQYIKEYNGKTFSELAPLPLHKFLYNATTVNTIASGTAIKNRENMILRMKGWI